MILSMDSSLFWFLLGIALMVLELVLPGFVVIFFGFGAIITALLTYTGILNDIILQLAVFIVSSVIILVIFRRRWSSSFKGNVSRKIKEGESIDNTIGDKVLVKKDIIPGKLGGKVEYNGTIWDADSDEEIKAGEIAIITERNSIRIKVKK
jgi:membrane protein implicated in regulation of membrane protease activity